MFPTLLFSITLPLFTFFRVLPPVPEAKTIAVREISLSDRYPDSWVNDVFRDNILLTLAYTDGMSVDPKNVNWNTLKKPSEYRLTLLPGEIFAFHEDVLPTYRDTVDKTTNAHFVIREGFRSSGYLAGDGICHLASLLYWVAKDAGLTAIAPTSHDFRDIPGIPREYGVSIFTIPNVRSTSNQQQNLYISNNRHNPITFLFHYEGDILSAKVLE